MKTKYVAEGLDNDKMDTPEHEAGESKDYEQHEIESAAESLVKAEHVKQDSKLHEHAMKHLSTKKDAISAALKSKKPKIKSLEHLRQIASDKSKC